MAGNGEFKAIFRATVFYIAAACSNRNHGTVQERLTVTFFGSISSSNECVLCLRLLQKTSNCAKNALIRRTRFFFFFIPIFGLEVA